VEVATPVEKAARGWLESSTRGVENHVASATQIVKTEQAVEKVVVGPIGGPKEALNKAKTLQNGVFSF